MSNQAFLLSGGNQSLDQSVAAFVQVKNEDYWIELIIRVLCSSFAEVIVMDNGSTDKTLLILDSLKKDGLNFKLFSYQESWRNEKGQLDPHSAANSAKNRIIQHHVRSRWLYVVDGDEIQYESTCKLLANPANFATSFIRGTVHFQFNSPKNFHRVTRKFCPIIRSQGGRIFDLYRSRWKEPGYDEFELKREHKMNPTDTIYAEEHTHFFPEAIVLHVPFHRRSTISTWMGANDLHVRRNYQLKDEINYEPLMQFPKESKQCCYSEHNYILKNVMTTNRIEFV